MKAYGYVHSVNFIKSTDAETPADKFSIITRAGDSIITRAGDKLITKQ